MIINEYRITMPFSTNEYQIGQLFSVAEASMHETGGGEGIEVLRNESYENMPLFDGRCHDGQYTLKKYHIASKVPKVIRVLAPKGSLKIEEKSWNAYPYCKTLLTHPKYMKDTFFILIESIHLEDKGTCENVFHLPPEKLKLRTVIVIDILDPLRNEKDYRENEDPGKFVSEKTGRGPLEENWMETADPVMTCYKLVTCQFKWFGLQDRVENLIQNTEKRLFHLFHRQVYCWMDRWMGMSMGSIRTFEDEMTEKLEVERSRGEVKGITANF